MSTARVTDLTAYTAEIESRNASVNAQMESLNKCLAEMRVSEEKKSNAEEASIQVINTLHAKFAQAHEILRKVISNNSTLSSNLRTKPQEYADVNVAAKDLNAMFKSAKELALSDSPSALMLDAKKDILMAAFKSFTEKTNKLKLISSESTKSQVEVLSKMAEELKDFIEKNADVLSKNKLLKESNDGISSLQSMIASVKQQLVEITKQQDDLISKLHPIKLLFDQTKATVIAHVKLLAQKTPKVPASNLLPGNQNNAAGNIQVMQPAAQRLVK
ncbi:MAG: hypothetical protein P4M14_05830 [Gammaproteobacteria bacterium]|nr:hypothetical protein [Gammaproteobacteria bacterium]